MRLSVVWESLADLLVVLTSLDNVVLGHTLLQEHWKLYKKMVKGLRHEPDRFGAGLEQVTVGRNKAVLRLTSWLLLTCSGETAGETTPQFGRQNREWQHAQHWS